MSVYKSYAKCVLGTKTLTLPTQDNGRLSGPPTELCSYHDNHSQQWPDSACQGKLRTRQLPVEASTEHCCFTQGVVSKQPPSYPTSFDPQASSTHPLLEQSLGYPAVPTKKSIPLLFSTLDWPGAGGRRKPSGHVLTKSHRYIEYKN